MSRARSARGKVKLTGSPEARKLATVVLEVLAGLITPTDAGQAVGVTVQRYYALEGRALQGVINALEPKRRGRHNTTQGELAALKSHNNRLQRQVTRLTALVRAAHRASGLAEGKPSRRLPGHRTRKPVTRALKAIEALREVPVPADDGRPSPASQEA